MPLTSNLMPTTTSTIPLKPKLVITMPPVLRATPAAGTSLQFQPQLPSESTMLPNYARFRTTDPRHSITLGTPYYPFRIDPTFRCTHRCLVPTGYRRFKAKRIQHLPAAGAKPTSMPPPCTICSQTDTMIATIIAATLLAITTITMAMTAARTINLTKVPIEHRLSPPPLISRHFCTLEAHDAIDQLNTVAVRNTNNVPTVQTIDQIISAISDQFQAQQLGVQHEIQKQVQTRNVCFATLTEQMQQLISTTTAAAVV
uniref:Uncharacterized protein n=1 Tax=Romanomermis culicivorax TaxID=13658 RepID=A0A915IMC8_ROMCU